MREVSMRRVDDTTSDAVLIFTLSSKNSVEQSPKNKRKASVVLNHKHVFSSSKNKSNSKSNNSSIIIMSSPSSSSSSSSVSPLTKIVFIKRVCLFACKDLQHLVKLTRGINHDFHETMTEFSGFKECCDHFSKTPVWMFYHSFIPMVGRFGYLGGSPKPLRTYYRRVAPSSGLIPSMISGKVRTCRWLLLDFFYDKTLSQVCGLEEVGSNRSLFGVLLKCIFESSSADEVIECIERLQQSKHLPEDLSSARLGASFSSLLHSAVRHFVPQFLRVRINSTKVDEVFVVNNDDDEDNNENTKQILHSITLQNYKQVRKLLHYLIRDCGIHPFGLVDQNGFNAFHVASLHTSVEIMKLLIEFLPDSERNDPKTIALFVNARVHIAPMEFDDTKNAKRKVNVKCLKEAGQTQVGCLKTALGVCVTRTNFRAEPPNPICEIVKYLRELGADRTILMKTQPMPKQQMMRQIRWYDRHHRAVSAPFLAKGPDRSRTVQDYFDTEWV